MSRPSYYNIEFDPLAWPRWFPEEPVGRDGCVIDARAFTSCEPYGGEPILLLTAEPGARSPITFGPFDMPIVDLAVGEAIREISGPDVQLVPAVAEDADVYILNVLRSVACIDEDRTIGAKWTKTDHRSDLAGDWRMVIELFVDPSRTGDAQIFRLKGWEIALIGSAALVARLSPWDDGIKFIPV